MSRRVVNLDFGWRFNRGDVTVNANTNTHSSSYLSCKAGNETGAAGKRFDDSEWRVIDLPHDYFSESEFSSDNLHSHGYRERCNAWYRKTFTLDGSYEGKEMFICFEGTAPTAFFYLNGSLMERTFSAYNETFFNATDRLYCDGRPNVLSVYIDGFATEGWWYEGAGIYRHVRLYVKEKLHIAHNGIFGKPVLVEGTKNSWTLNVSADIENGARASDSGRIRATLYDGDKIVCQSEGKDTEVDYASVVTANLKMKVSRPHRWDIDDPYLYTLKVELVKDGETLDEESVRIGFRTFCMDAEKGFFLNGRPIKIKGTCNHQDHAGVGVAVPDSVQYYRIKRLKEMGTNAYRCSHNLPAKEILDACDEIGLIVMDENRRFESREEVLRAVESMIKRDRNHPSVIFWSLFNEEPLQNTEEGARIFRRMYDRAKHLDDSRFIMGAINGSMEYTGMESDVVGINYYLYNIDEMHAHHPEKPVFGSENNSTLSTRGCYETDRENKQVLACYDEIATPWGTTVRDCWRFARQRDFYAGIFIWTGFDYRGEPTPFKWPSVSSQFGIMDTCGFPKDCFYFNKACFTDKPMVHLLPHWNHKKGDTVRVMAVSNCDEVELFLNGRTLGRKTNEICDDTAEWLVPYESGRITAKAYRNGKCVAKAEQRTAGKPYAVKVDCVNGELKNDGHDTAIFNVRVVDKRGVTVPTADNLINFEITGDGYVRGVGNGDPNSHEPDVVPYRHLYNGYAQALVTSKLGGEKFTFRAYGEGLVEDVINVTLTDVGEVLMPANDSGDGLEGFTMSSKIYAERPDPNMYIADDDMNSFTAVTFESGAFQKDFLEGYRIYRVKTNSGNRRRAALHFSNIHFRKIEVHVNGVKVDDLLRYVWGDYATPVFDVEPNTDLDIRILLYAREEDPVYGTGISGKVTLTKVL